MSSFLIGRTSFTIPLSLSLPLSTKERDGRKFIFCPPMPRKKGDEGGNPEKMGNYKMCVFFTRKFRDAQILHPPDIKQAFHAFSRGFDHLTAPQLQRFLVEFQGETHATVNYAEWIIDQMRRLCPVLTFDDFIHYLFCDDLNAPIISQASIHFSSSLFLKFWTGRNHE
ncbi:hypothetical protein ACLOJK_031701 [Asimina triloba]